MPYDNPRMEVSEVKILEALKSTVRPVHEIALRFLLSGVGMERVVNGIALRVDPRSRHSFAPSHDAEAAEHLRRHLRPGAVVWNVGANVGVWALQLVHWLKGTGKIVAFEPNPHALKMLRANLKLNRALHQVEVIEAAVGERIGAVQFFTCGPDEMARAGRPNPLLQRTQEQEVRVTTLDAVATARGRVPDWIIMDIEGWEIAALQGGIQLLKDTQMIVELHPSAWEWSGHSRRDLETLLEMHKLEVIPLAGQGDPLAEHGQVLLRRKT